MTKHIVAIIQARMGSSRLPGKSLLPIAGQPLIWHVVHRLRQSRLIGDIILATTDAPQDDALAAWARENDVRFVRGSEDDVLGRFALAAATAGDPDIIVRVNADAPLVDAAFVDVMVQAMLDDDSDFVMLRPGVSVAHDGVDPMSARAFRLMLDEAREDPVAREHVTAWLKLNADRIKVSTLDPDPAYLFQGARLSIDTPADVAFIEAVHRRLDAQAGEAALTDLIALLRRDPSLMGMNGHVRQKKASARSGMVVIRCDGGAAIGLGHVKRCLSLARSLRDEQGLGVIFAMIGDATSQDLVTAEGFVVKMMPAGDNEAAWLSTVLTEARADTLVLDIRTELGADDIRALKSAVRQIVALDDGSPRRLAADLAVYPPVPQVRDLAWTGETGRKVGWGWAILGSGPWLQPRPLASGRVIKRVLVAMGGSDPGRLTVPAVRDLASLGKSVRPVVVLGPAMRDRDAVEQACRRLAPDAEIHMGPDSLLPIAADCDLAVLAFGVSAFECAHVGTPALYLGLTPDHVRSASAFHEAGFGLNLGLADELRPNAVADAVSGLLQDAEKRRAMAAAGRLGVDGRGAERLAAEIARRVQAAGRLRQAG